MGSALGFSCQPSKKIKLHREKTEILGVPLNAENGAAVDGFHCLDDVILAKATFHQRFIAIEGRADVIAAADIHAGKAVEIGIISHFDPSRPCSAEPQAEAYAKPGG